MHTNSVFGDIGEGLKLSHTPSSSDEPVILHGLAFCECENPTDPIAIGDFLK